MDKKVDSSTSCCVLYVLLVCQLNSSKQESAFLHCTCLPDMEFLEVLTEGLNRVLLVRGGGREVITIYSWTDSSGPPMWTLSSDPLYQSKKSAPRLLTTICLFDGADFNTQMSQKPVLGVSSVNKHRCCRMAAYPIQQSIALVFNLPSLMGTFNCLTKEAAHPMKYVPFND